MKSAASQGQLMLSLGALLSTERERRGIAVEKAAKETRMRPQRIRDMEGDDLSHFTNPSYARMFIIAYAKYLGIPMQTIHDHLPDRGEPGSEGYQYINAAPDELPLLRRDLVSRPLRRGWLPAIVVVSLLGLLAVAAIAVVYIVVNLPRIVPSPDTATRAAQPDSTPLVVEKTIVLQDPHLENLPAPQPTPVDPVAPSVLNPPSSTAPASFTEDARLVAPPRPTPVVVIGGTQPIPPANLQSTAPSASPAEDEDRAFLLDSEADQRPPAN